MITRAGGQFVGSFDDLIAVWRRHRPGDSIAIDYHRGRSGRDLQTTATLTGPPEATPAVAPLPDGTYGKQSNEGLEGGLVGHFHGIPVICDLQLQDLALPSQQ